MEFQEAKNLIIGRTVFVIGKDGKVQKKKVTGIKLKGAKQLDITYVDYAAKNFTDRYILPHEELFLKESDALEIILHVKKSQIISIGAVVDSLRKRLVEVLEEEEGKQAEIYGE